MRVSTNEKFGDEVAQMAAAYSNKSISEKDDAANEIKSVAKLSAAALVAIIIGAVLCVFLVVLGAGWSRRKRQM